MSKQETGMDRREFIRTGLRGAGLVGLGSAAGLVGGRYLTGSAPPAARGGTPDSGDPRALSAADPGLSQYREAGRIRTRFQSLRAVAAGPDDRIYVAGDTRIQVFDRNADPHSGIELRSAPQCLTVSEDSRVYVGLRDQIEVYDSHGAQEQQWRAPGALLTCIAVSKDDVFAADAARREVWRYSSQGRYIRRIGKKDSARNVPGFVVPSPYFDLAVAPDGLLRVANPGRHRVEAYTFDGDFELSWGQASMDLEGFCGCCNPINFALLPDGKVVTSEKGLPRIKIHDVDGSFVGVVAGPELFRENEQGCCGSGEVSSPPQDNSTCQSGGIDVAVDSRGRVLAMDPIAGLVRIFEPAEAA